MALPPAGVFRAVGTFSTGTSTSPATGKPTNTLQDDVMLAWVSASSASITITPPTGWISLGKATVSTTTVEYFYKVVTNETGTTTYTWTLSASVAWACQIITYTSIDPAIPVNVSGISTSLATTTPATSNLTTTLPDTLNVVSFVGLSVPTYTPSGTTERSDAAGVEFADVAQAAPGATGAISSTASGSGDFICFIVALNRNTRGTRCYFDSAAAAAVTPGTFAAIWDSTGSATVKRMNLVKGSSTLTNRAVAEAVSTNNFDVCTGQYVMGPLGTGSLSGAFKCQMLSLESAAAANDFAQIAIKIIKPDGTTRGTAFTGQTDTATSGSEFATTATNAMYPKPTLARDLTATDYINGDYLVVELGYRANNTSLTSMTGTLRDGEGASTDYLEDETVTTNTLCPWIEFTRGVLMAGEGPEFKPGPYLVRAA
jgi:hypothetical protein